MKILWYSILMIFSVYTVISLFPFLQGATNAGGSCLDKPRNIEIFFPVYKFGCWLHGRQGEKYYGGL